MSLSICAVFKNEAPYLREWIEFHRIVGVERFYLYENGSSDEWQSVIKSYIREGIVRLVDWSTGPGQLRGSKWLVGAYQHFIEHYAGRNDWVAFIDCDEFLFSPCESDVSNLLGQRPFCEYGALGVNWMCFGSGKQNHFHSDPVIQRFALRSKDEDRINGHIKTILRMDCAAGATNSPHCFDVRGGTRGESGEFVDGSFRFPPTHKWLRINHYVTKSKEEWDRRHTAGLRVDITRENEKGYFDDYQSTEVRDTEILKYLPELRRRLSLENLDSF